MSYTLKEVSIRTNNSVQGLQKIREIWADITSGKLPILFDNEQNFHQGISPLSKYSNYAKDQNGDYDLTIMGVTSNFFGQLEQLVSEGKYIKYDECADSLQECATNAWNKVWNDYKEGKIERSFSEDYESTVPAEYTKDGKPHCYLYIAIQ